MKRLLHIIATPREDESRTLQVSEVFLDAFQKKHADWVIDELNLGKEELPPLSQKSVSGKYVLLGGHELFGSLRETWAEILQMIERFKTADLYLISTPMWNFHIPYLLKQYIDLIVQPKYLFRYTESGNAEGLVKNKKMIVISSSGGIYGDNNDRFLEPYLRMIFGFVGFTDFTFIKAEGMDLKDQCQQNILAAQKNAIEVGSNA